VTLQAEPTTAYTPNKQLAFTYCRELVLDLTHVLYYSLVYMMQAEGGAGYARERISDSTAAATKRANALVSHYALASVLCSLVLVTFEVVKQLVVHAHKGCCSLVTCKPTSALSVVRLDA
jgi:hypothetical protein